MAWIYLAESEGSQSPFPLGLAQSHSVKSIDIAKEFSCHGNNAENCHLLRFGMTSLVCEERCCLTSILFTEASPARISVLLELEKAWKESEADFSSRSYDCVANYDPNSCSWKTSQLSLLEGEYESLTNLPVFGMTADGRLFLPLKLELHILEDDGSYWPTPTAQETGRTPEQFAEMAMKHRNGNLKPCHLSVAVKMWPTPTVNDAQNRFNTKSQMKRNSPGLAALCGTKMGGQLNPKWVEWLMGYRLEWTALEPWAMQWFQSKLGKRSKD